MGDGFCRQFSPEQMREIERGWREQKPAAPVPPIANAHLAVELSTGLDAVRDFEFQGRTLRMAPTPYPTAIRLLAWSQKLERLESLGDVLTQHLPELRKCYQQIAQLADSLVLEPAGERLFEQNGRAADFHRVLSFALSSGNELERHEPRPTGVTQRYDATFYLYRYLERFGAVPGMVILNNGRPQPASWRHFCQGMKYLVRDAAEEAIQSFGAMAAAHGGGDPAQRWIDAQSAATGAE